MKIYDANGDYPEVVLRSVGVATRRDNNVDVGIEYDGYVVNSDGDRINVFKADSNYRYHDDSVVCEKCCEIAYWCVRAHQWGGYPFFYDPQEVKRHLAQHGIGV